MTLDLSQMNENQRAAVSWDKGPLLVLAGPGSGKTRVLTYRIVRILEQTQGAHFRILALTFTNKAAAEMRERVAAIAPGTTGDRALLTTFHSFAGEILRQHGHLVGLRPDFGIISQESDRTGLLEEALAGMAGSDELSLTAERLLPTISRLLDHAADEAGAAQILSDGGVVEAERIAEAYARYRATMIARNTLDFGGLLATALDLLRSRPPVRRLLHRVYTHVCVDEFQDTNEVQYLLLRELVRANAPDLFVVADDDQVIYQWNGASPERLETLKRDFGAVVIQLPENYRCPPRVIDLANALIAKNQDRSPGKSALAAKKTSGTGEAVRLRRFASFEEEATWVAEDIASREPASRKGCVVLARARKPLEQVIARLAERNVPAHLAARKDEFASEPMRWLHGVLRLANARQDRGHLRRVCRAFYALEGINLDPQDVASAAAAGHGGDFLRSFASAALARPELEAETRAMLRDALPGLIEKLAFRDFVAAALSWIDSVGPDGGQDDAENSDYEEEKATWQELVAEIEGQYGREQVTLNLLLQELDMRSKAPRPPAGSVPCFTIHAAKGLEFDHVYLVGLVEDQLPSWAAIKKGSDSRELQEERRNCFVAITRCQETLTLSFADTFGGWRKRPSRFLFEMGVLS